MEFIKNLLSNNNQSSMRFCLLVGLVLTIFLVIVYTILVFKYVAYGLSIDVLDKITYLIGTLMTSLIIGKVAQKFAEVKDGK